MGILRMHEDFSADLKTRREDSGLTVQDIFERTRINIHFLEAIESGRFDVLPEVYIRLFLRKYAQEIGLDPDAVLRRYESAGGRLPHTRSPSPSAPPPLPTGSLDGGEETPSPEVTPTPEGGSRSRMRGWTSSRSGSRAVIIAGAAVGALAIAAIAFLSYRPDAPPAGTFTPAARSNTGSGALPARDRSYRLTIPNADAHGDSISLEVSAVARATVSLTIDEEEEPRFRRTVSIGDHFIWKARRKLLLKVDRADALEIVLQGWRLPLNAKSESRLKLFVSPASVWVEEIQSPAASDDSF